MTCAELVADLQTRIDSARAEVDAWLGLLESLFATIRADRDAYCDLTPLAPRYSPDCCNRFLTLVASLPTDLRNRRDQVYQWSLDALAAIDCGSTDWQAQVIECQRKLLDLLDLGTEYRQLYNTISADYASKSAGCPTSNPGSG